MRFKPEPPDLSRIGTRRTVREDKTLFGIRLGIRKVLLACNNEYTRLNCSPTD